MAVNVELAGSPSLAKACLQVVEQLGDNLRELESLEDTGSFGEAQATLTRFLADQERERQEAEAQIAAEVRHLEYSQAACQKLARDSKESELSVQSTEQVVLRTRDIIAKAEAVLALNEEKLVSLKKELEEQRAATARAEESLSLQSSKVESLRMQLAARNFLSEAELWDRAVMEAERTRQYKIHRLREQIRSLANQDI